MNPEDDPTMDDAPGAEGAQTEQGDGLHHHKIDQDEGGGYHSVHTFPDGQQAPDDHVDLKDATDAMQRAFQSDGAEQDSGNEDMGDMPDCGMDGDIGAMYGNVGKR
jgi:hypothetical protein